MKTTLAITIFSLTAIPLIAQVPDKPQPASKPAPVTSTPTSSSSSGTSSGSSSSQKSQPLFGGLLPTFNPGSEFVTWNGQNWNINNNRIFEARFEKYLNAPEETTATDKQYQAIVNKILSDLAPQNLTNQSLDEAFKLLPKASNYEIDARLCDALADAVYSAWRSQAANARIAQANESLHEERKKVEWNTKMATDSDQLDQPPPNKAAVSEWRKQQDMKRKMTMQPYLRRLAEVNALIKANQAKNQLSKWRAKIDFQALMVQFFMQRRFQHVLMATRFYRAVFSDSDSKLDVGKDAKDLFSRSTGMPPTVGTLDSMANEAIHDVHESVQAFQFLVEKKELDSATKRLAEAFAIGEYLPDMRTLPRSEKRKVLKYAQASNQLVSALNVKDYTLAEKLVKELQKMAKDFDASKPTAAIETAKTVSAMHIAKARNAAVSGDKTTLETELRAATEIWPRNPQLAEVSQMIFKQGDVQQQALVELDQLISEHNYRQIWKNRVRYIAATALYPNKQKQLAGILQDMETIQGAIIRANEIAKHGDYAGAWESIKKTQEKYPDDNKLNQELSDFTTKAADFVRTINTAQDLEKKGQIGASLAWYLKAQKIYPASEFAQDGIAQLVKKVLPGS